MSNETKSETPRTDAVVRPFIGRDEVSVEEADGLLTIARQLETEINAAKAEIERLTEGIQVANEVADRAIKHRNHAEAEIERLTKERDEAKRLIYLLEEHPENYEELLLERDELRAKLAEAEKDRERLEKLEKMAWVDDGDCDRCSTYYYTVRFPTGEDYYKPSKKLPFRQAIDAAKGGEK